MTGQFVKRSVLSIGFQECQNDILFRILFFDISVITETLQITEKN